MSPAVKSILERVASWPAEDQEELSELARGIEARRSGVYRLSDEERAAIDAVKKNADAFQPAPAWQAELNKLSEGQSHTLGAYHRPWK